MEKLLRELLELETTSKNLDAINKSIKIVAKYLKNNCEDIFIQTYQNKKPSLVATSQETKEPDIFLVGHLDVVPANYPKAFAPYLKGSRLYARGASDMKGPDSAMITAFTNALKDDPGLNIGLILTTDEEVGGFDGVNFLINQKGYSCKVAFIPDGGDNWQICTDEKAVFHVTIQAQGRSAHGSRPWLGKNANNTLIETYQKIEKAFTEKWGKPTQKNSWKPTVNLGTINGGTATNSVSDQAEMTLDIRFPASISKDEVVELLNAATDHNPDIKWEEKIFGEAMHTEKDSLYIKSWLDILKTPDRPESKLPKEVFSRGHGASDARFFSAKDIPVLMSKPTCSAIHGDNEWIDINDLAVYRDKIVKWILKV